MENIKQELENAGYDFAVAIATEAEINAGAACGQLAIVNEEGDTKPCLRPYHQAVVDEKRELDEKLEALSDEIRSTHLFADMDVRGRRRLIAQEAHMQGYSDILAERIAVYEQIYSESLPERSDPSPSLTIN